MNILKRIKTGFKKGFFVTDCPRCHQDFSGNSNFAQHVCITEKDGGVTHYRYICEDCHKEAIGEFLAVTWDTTTS